jgi:hypothetical protein
MMHDDYLLTGHCTMLINDECYTFPLPRFASTYVADWSSYGDGVFEQTRWSPEQIRKWHHKNRRYDWAHKWFGWVERLPIKIPKRLDVEDDYGRTYKELWWFRVGPLLLNGLTGRPGPPGAHLVTRNLFNQLVLQDCEAVSIVGNAATGYFWKGQAFEIPGLETVAIIDIPQPDETALDRWADDGGML